MAVSPKVIPESTNKIMSAWQTLAKDASFGGMTLAEYKARVQPSFDARTTVETLNQQLTAALDARDDADRVTNEANQKVVKGVMGDPNFGEDSDLYEAMGYVRKSERKSGLTRKKAAPPEAPKK